jgi:hypothetical protein
VAAQAAHKHGDGYAYYQRNSPKAKPGEARRALKSKISNAIYAALHADAAAQAAGMGGQAGNDSSSSAIWVTAAMWITSQWRRLRSCSQHPAKPRA